MISSFNDNAKGVKRYAWCKGRYHLKKWKSERLCDDFSPIHSPSANVVASGAASSSFVL